MASLDRQVTQNGLGVINAMARESQWDCENATMGYASSRLKARTVVGDDESLAKMIGGDVDVEPYLYSRNTIGHGNHNSNYQRPKVKTRYKHDPSTGRSVGDHDPSKARTKVWRQD